MKNFQLLFNEISDAMFLHDFEGNILRVNNYACQRLGYTREEFASMNVSDFAQDDIITNWQERIEILRQKGTFSFETTYLTKDNELIHIEIISKIIELENNLLILTSGRDISERKNYEFQLKEARKIAEENELELQTIFDKVPTSLILFDQESRILRINQKGIIKFKVDEKNLKNQRIGDVIACVDTSNGNVKCGLFDSCINCDIANIINKTIYLNKEYNKEEIKISLFQDNAVVEKTMLISTTILKKNGKTNFLATIDDITSRKQMEQDLIAAKQKAEESEKLKTAFLSNISHEIRTPLNGILGFIEIFEDDQYHFSHTDKKEFIDIMRKSGERLVNTVTDLVEVSKLDSGIQTLSEEKIELNNELLNFINEQEHRFVNPNILFVHEIGLALKDRLVIIDKIKLFQILKYLINNAYKFTSKGRVKLVVDINNADLIFSVEDTGIGIDAKFRDAIYEPFQQADTGLCRKYDGNGLGLTIAKKLVDKLGGNIWFESEIGKGTTFYFSVPLKPTGIERFIPSEIVEHDLDKLKLSGKKILIAEDEIANYLFLEAVLSKEGCELVHAFNGRAAVEIFASDPTFDIIIMDIRMPVMDGLEATCKIKEIRNDVPIVAYSAYVMNSEAQKALEAGCIDYISKPAKKRQILRTIEKHIRPSDGLVVN